MLNIHFGGAPALFFTQVFNIVNNTYRFNASISPITNRPSRSVGRRSTRGASARDVHLHVRALNWQDDRQKETHARIHSRRTNGQEGNDNVQQGSSCSSHVSQASEEAWIDLRGRRYVVPMPPRLHTYLDTPRGSFTRAVLRCARMIACRSKR